MGRVWDRDSCVIALRDYYSTYNKTPSKRDFNSISGYPSYATVVRYCGSWSLAMELASIPVRVLHEATWNKVSIKIAIENFYLENKRIPKQKEFSNSNNCPNHKTVAKYYGSWNTAILAANLSPKYLVLKAKEVWTKEIIKQTLIKMSQELGYIPSLQEFCAVKEHPSDTVVKARFGSWNNAILYAALLPNSTYKFTKEIIADLLLNYCKDNKYTPSQKEFCSIENHPSSDTVIKYWDSWNNLLEHLKLPPNINNGYGCSTIGLDKHIYRSKAEAYFCDKYLFGKYNYIIEPKYPNSNKLYDWYIPELDLYIELDGELRPKTIKDKIEINKILNRNLLIIPYKSLYRDTLNITKETLWANIVTT